MTEAIDPSTLTDGDLIREIGERFFGHIDKEGRVRWQAAMARATGISQSMLSEIAKGDRVLSLKMRSHLAAWAKAEIPLEQARRVRRNALLKNLRDRWQTK